MRASQGPFSTPRPTPRHAACRALKPRSEDLVLRIESGAQDVTGSDWPAALLVASGRNVFELIDHAVSQAAALSGTTKPLSEKHVPDSLNYFGWCTWDAFYSTVSAEVRPPLDTPAATAHAASAAMTASACVQGVQAGLRSLQAGGITPRTLIIDDGWQMTEVDEDYEGAKKVSKKRPILGLSLSSGGADAPDKPGLFGGSRDEEFEESEQAVLAAYADALPGGAELMNTMPALSDPGAPTTPRTFTFKTGCAGPAMLRKLSALSFLSTVCCSRRCQTPREHR